MTNSKNEWRSYHARLSKITSVDDYKRVDKLYQTLSKYFDELQQDPIFVEKVLNNIREYKTNFVKAMANDYGKPYKSWTGVNNAAKYYRIMMTQAREVMKGFSKRLLLAKVCEEFGWDSSGDNIKNIQDAAVGVLGYRLKYRDIANLCQAGTIPVMPDHVSFELDYSSEDNQICEILDCDLDHVAYRLRVDSSERAVLDVQLPSTLREHVSHYARPNIIPVFSNDGGDSIVDYEVMISYEPVARHTVGECGNVLGVDIGKIKAASMVALYSDGTVSREYLVTKETQRVLEKLNRVYDEVKASKEAIKECNSDGRKAILLSQLEGQNVKLSGLRLSFARLVGRDIAGCACELGCDTVHLEDLARLIARGAQITGRWNFAAIKKSVIEACSLCGVRVVLVDPAFTSKTNPFDNSEVVAGGNRLIDCGCCVLDRDYLAALNIARCVAGKRVRSCGVLDFVLNRKVLVLGGVCCILRSRKKRFK